MAISDVAAPRQSAHVSDAKQAISEAAVMLDFDRDSLSAAEITSRVEAAKTLLQDISTPSAERRELDQVLMRIAFREPNTTDEARTMIRLIFKGLRPKDHLTGPQRDKSGRLTPITDPDLPLRLLETDQLAESEDALEQSEC